MGENTFSADNLNAILSNLMQNPDSINKILNSFSQSDNPPPQNDNVDFSSLLNNVNPDLLNSLFSSMGGGEKTSQSGFDPSMLFNLMGNMGGNDSFQNQDNTTRLLLSLKPFVSPQRQNGIDNLCHILKYVHIARLMGFDITKFIKL